MDPRLNPYTPNAGARPPVLVGRDDQLRSFEILLARLERGSTEQSLLITGLRGVGKTVLLNEFRALAVARDWVAVEAEITRQTAFGARMAQLARRALLQVAPKARWRDVARRAAAVVKSFTLTVASDGALTAGLDIDPAPGLADSGDLADDLSDLFVALGEAAADQGVGVVFLLDEVQFLSAAEFEALIAALHRAVQRALPITLVGAGLPQLPRIAGEARSYAERLFKVAAIGSLSDSAARAALEEPARRAGASFTADATDEVLRFTEGYPYFIQVYGKVVWDEAESSSIDKGTVLALRPLVEATLDESFFHLRLERVTPHERRYLQAMASLGPGPSRAGDVARVLGRRVEQVGPTRSRLIEKGLLYTPGHGLAAFTVPQFDRYLLRLPRPVWES